MNRKTHHTVFAVVIFGFLILAGCSDDDPVAADLPSVGTIVVNPTPDTINAPWILSGPAKSDTTGTGDQTLTDMSTGDYTLTWGDVTDYVTPPLSTKALAAEGELTFSGTYVYEVGTIIIDQTPDVLVGAGWSLTGPQDGSGSGDQTLTDMPLGDYTLTWDSLEGWAEPQGSTHTVSVGSTVTFPGTYMDLVPLATNPDILMSNFKIIYEGMFFNEFVDILHTDFRMILLQSTIHEWEGSGNPLQEMYFDQDLEARIHRNMFENLPGINPVGGIVPPVDSIHVDILEKIGTWEPVEQSMEYFGGFGSDGAYMARYKVLIHFNTPNQHRFEVDQEVDVIAIPIDGIWHLLGQIGYESHFFMGTESMSLGTLLSFYR